MSEKNIKFAANKSSKPAKPLPTKPKRDKFSATNESDKSTTKSRK